MSKKSTRPRTQNPPRWTKTTHAGIYVDKEGNYKVRAAVKIDGRVRELKRQLDARDATLEDARELRVTLMERLRGEPPSNPAHTSVLDFAELWIARQKTRNRARVTEVYLQILSDHVLPELAHIQVQSLSRADVIAMTDAWEAKRKPDGQPYSKATIQGWWKVARVLIQDAVAEFQLPFDPSSRVRLPRMTERKVVREQRTLNSTDLCRLLDWVERHRPRRYAEVALLALGGLRPSELFALEPADVDLATGELRIERSVDRGNLDAPKTERSDRDSVSGTRSVVVPERARLAVREHRKRSMARQWPGGATPPMLFPSRVGTYRTPSSLQKVFAAAERGLELDIHVTPQVLRRTYNTLMKDLTDRETLHAMIGHTDDAMTELYSHVGYEPKAEAAERLGRMVSTANA